MLQYHIYICIGFNRFLGNHLQTTSLSMSSSYPQPPTTTITTSTMTTALDQFLHDRIVLMNGMQLVSDNARIHHRHHPTRQYDDVRRSASSSSFLQGRRTAVSSSSRWDPCPSAVSISTEHLLNDATKSNKPLTIPRRHSSIGKEDALLLRQKTNE